MVSRKKMSRGSLVASSGTDHSSLCEASGHSGCGSRQTDLVADHGQRCRDARLGNRGRRRCIRPAHLRERCRRSGRCRHGLFGRGGSTEGGGAASATAATAIIRPATAASCTGFIGLLRFPPLVTHRDLTCLTASSLGETYSSI